MATFLELLIYLVRAMFQLHFKTNISSLCQLGTKLCLIT